MASTMLLKPTLHVEILLKSKMKANHNVCDDISNLIKEDYSQVKVGQQINDFESTPNAKTIQSIIIADYTGPAKKIEWHRLDEVELDVQSYTLKVEKDMPHRKTRRSMSHEDDEDEGPQTRVLPLPHVVLKDEWDSLIFDDALPSQLLRYLTRMLGVMKQPGLNLATFNWNRLCLLHGPPGSGKSTLCRALAQKLSIRLSKTFTQATLVEANTNSMLSKYFGESGKLIGALFDKVQSHAQSPSTLVCVVMDEVETIAGSREKVTSGVECSDGLRATNQLLTALDRMRSLPNVIILCTSNLIHAIDPAFLDRVDIKTCVPTPSPAAIYNIFRSCLNELVRASLIDLTASSVSSSSAVGASRSSPSPNGSKRRAVSVAPSSNSNTTLDDQQVEPTSPLSEPSPSSAHSWTDLTVPTIPTYVVTQMTLSKQPDSPGWRVWELAKKCEGFSGRTLRRLPILGLAMYTWGGNCSLQDAVSALEAAVNEELKVK
ncbi:hypothetical protein M409DRAFT_66601 [Zasmidium cellare ATCC 36951]|uniref:AAA+ ATPase domain-containing protein n=1 Tax=Zasmidium cellare ATCC 36951 TaxID=1080233 RepID=A0A6A6CH69_ZASCE|nr:uncharacterized protein M409DRAFT_66601 [Zasmidium cellare ATCC 36951]KAF2166587.1 hypothetical protein M409DRAFT_66601 [Zasmidium cellare ATCC 36951]